MQTCGETASQGRTNQKNIKKEEWKLRQNKKKETERNSKKIKM